ncbi:MAG TPA: hypothetical protein VHO69_19170, partial [Phototrophicaceae bacterium]|nr:hypothetical protein [Phototrophicaceae bacterium]
GAVQFYFLFRHHFGAGLGFNRLARIAVGGVLMGLIIYLLRDWNFFLIAAIAALFYGSFVWFTGAFSPEEQSQMVGFITRRLRSRIA